MQYQLSRKMLKAGFVVAGSMLCVALLSSCHGHYRPFASVNVGASYHSDYFYGSTGYYFNPFSYIYPVFYRPHYYPRHYNGWRPPPKPGPGYYRPPGKPPGPPPGYVRPGGPGGKPQGPPPNMNRPGGPGGKPQGPPPSGGRPGGFGNKR